ncbi:Oxidoreductase family, NAD-binding Rossmann fold [Chitinophaga jiangningensis]|uniref:Oxidoreductase family, NAD-binding Rossmann fold n=1 Tax=Chitinophaga jiangningensis TaxID=1419482 RepID=A0A1M6VCW5_9BACT|nr:Gfo/Idh/MocA family oxidoreductase [Chitinophaga jiangningensis]SHK79377.1 Oxidoreductase family, NAD-binding Rossmann fold [Chitinophaga jiangningensis]
MMKQPLHRRSFLKNTAAAGIGLSMLGSSAKLFANEKKPKVRIGLIGVGARGLSHLDLALRREDVDLVAFADPDTAYTVPKARDMITKAYGAKRKVAEYTNGPEDFRNMLKRDDIDAVIIATPWEWHSIMAIAAMKAGKIPAVEVCGASDIQECWELVNTSEETGIPVFGMENVCYRRDVMAVLQMVREGLFGEITHLQGGYQHDLRAVKFNNGKQYYGGGVEFGENALSEAKWRTNHSVHRNADLYPSHGLGPICNAININRGNRLLSLTSVATKSRGLHKYIVDNSSESHPNAKVKFKLGDIVSTLITTNNGETIMLSHDTNSPRPYSLNFRVQGTNGLWMDDQKQIYIEKLSPKHDVWESTGKPDDPASYYGKYDHPLWKRYAKDAAGAGHGGMDWFVMNSFVESIKRGAPFALDVYDMATWYAITPLSEQSILEGGGVQYIPDFTRGRWMNRKPIFALDDQY